MKEPAHSVEDIIGSNLRNDKRRWGEVSENIKEQAPKLIGFLQQLLRSVDKRKVPADINHIYSSAEIWVKHYCKSLIELCDDLDRTKSSNLVFEALDKAMEYWKANPPTPPPADRWTGTTVDSVCECGHKRGDHNGGGRESLDGRPDDECGDGCGCEMFVGVFKGDR